MVVDGSDSISDGDFSTIKTAILSLLDELTLGEDNVKFGLVLYSSNITTVIALSSDKKQIRTEIATLMHSRQGTNTHLGINQMNLMFAQQGRKGVPKVGIVITDGISKDPEETATEAATAKSNNINMYAVGITKHIDMTELKKIASSDDKAISLKTFNQLKTGITSLMKQVCPEITTTTTTTTTTMTKAATTTEKPTIITRAFPIDCVTSGPKRILPNEDEREENYEGSERDDDDVTVSRTPHRTEDSSDEDEYQNSQTSQNNVRPGLWNALFGRHRMYDDDYEHNRRDYYGGYGQYRRQYDDGYRNYRVMYRKRPSANLYYRYDD